jgi:hypothetical protein
LHYYASKYILNNKLFLVNRPCGRNNVLSSRLRKRDKEEEQTKKDCRRFASSQSSICLEESD